MNKHASEITDIIALFPELSLKDSPNKAHPERALPVAKISLTHACVCYILLYNRVEKFANRWRGKPLVPQYVYTVIPYYFISSNQNYSNGGSLE